MSWSLMGVKALRIFALFNGMFIESLAIPISLSKALSFIDRWQVLLCGKGQCNNTVSRSNANVLISRLYAIPTKLNGPSKRPRPYTKFTCDKRPACC